MNSATAAAAAAAAAAGAAAGAQAARNQRTGGYEGLEKKFIDYEYGPTAISAGVAGGEADPASGSISAMARGDGQSDRDGRQCTLFSVHVSGRVILDADSAGGSNPLSGTARIVLVLDTQTNASQLNAEDVFVDPSSASHDDLSFRNLQYQRRFRVLATETVNLRRDLGFDSTTNSSGQTYAFQMHKDFKNGIRVDHNGTTADVATITDNSLHVLAMSNDQSGPMTLTYYSRVRFSR